MDFLVVGSGMFGAAIARHLAPYAAVTVVGPEARTDGPGGYGAHHDEGRIIGDLSQDPVWSELNRRARDGMAEAARGCLADYIGELPLSFGLPVADR